MAKIKPFRAWRYHEQFDESIEEYVSPLFDVVSDKYRKILYQNEFNSIHLSVPLEGPDGKVLNGRISDWKTQEIIRHDKTPAIYVYYQYFKLPGDEYEYCRKGFICNIKTYDWEDMVIMRHEDTMPHSVNDRKKVLEHTLLNVSPTHGLYTDPDHTIERDMDLSIQSPIYDSEDYQGVRNVLGVIHDFEIIQKFIRLLEDKQVILADGHHRYQGALAYRNEQRTANPNHSGDEMYNYHMMYLTNTESDDLRIFPTHRLIKDIEGFDEDEFVDKLSEYFHIRSIDNEEDLAEIISGKKWAFGLMVGDNTYKIRLKQEKIFAMDWNLPEQVKMLDLSVLHYFVFEKVLGIPKSDQPKSDHIQFERNFNKCLKKVLRGKADAAIITQDIPMHTVKEVCFSGHTLPQKSTYFYPKVICGYLFGSIKEEDNNEPIDRCF